MHADHVDLLLQYALLRAGEEDDFVDRDLGPIHLLKYVYLADLAYARSNQGETYTGARWRFYHFGPWSLEVHQRIEPAMANINARKFEGQSDYEDRADWVRWSCSSETLLAQKQRQIPLAIKIDLDRLVHKFKKDTPSLLDYVYRTSPMLSASPNTFLDFSTEVRTPRETVSSTAVHPLTAKQRKKLREAGRAIREKFATRPAASERFVPKVAQLDEVYAAGLKWLDDLAGVPLQEQRLTAQFSPEVWGSSTRKADDVP